MHQNLYLKEFSGKSNPNDINIRAACKKCGFVGHLPFQCRNYITSDPNKEMILDVSSTSSSDEGGPTFISPLVKLRNDETKIEEMKKMIKESISFNKPALNDDILGNLKKELKKRLKKKKKHKKHRNSDEEYSEDELSRPALKHPKNKQEGPSNMEEFDKSSVLNKSKFPHKSHVKSHKKHRKHHHSKKHKHSHNHENHK